MVNIAEIIANIPITNDGFIYSKRTDDEIKELANNAAIPIVIDFLKDVDKTKSITSKISSYSLKHLVENVTGVYISNGAFIVGAIAAGFEARKSGKNAKFNISIKSFAKKFKKYSDVPDDDLSPYLYLEMAIVRTLT